MSTLHIAALTVPLTLGQPWQPDLGLEYYIEHFPWLRSRDAGSAPDLEEPAQCFVRQEEGRALRWGCRGPQ